MWREGQILKPWRSILYADFDHLEKGSNNECECTPKKALKVEECTSWKLQVHSGIVDE